MHHLVLFIMGFLAYFLGAALMVLCGQIERAIRAIQGSGNSSWLDDDEVDMIFIGGWPLFMPIVLLAACLEWTHNRIEVWAEVKLTKIRTREEELASRLVEAMQTIADLEQKLEDKAQEDYLNAWGK